MSNLLATLTTAGNALGVYEQALNVVQNNITNSSTPGYAKQSLNLEALPFDITSGLTGGVAARGLDSARSEYAEEEVRRQNQSLGFFEAQAQGASSIENQFDVSGTSGVPGALNQLFQSFSAWSVSPGDASARQSVIASAGNLAAQIHSTAQALARTSQNEQDQIGSTVDQVNQLASTIQQYNVLRLRQSGPDPNQDANVHAALEQLSELADVTALTQADGTVTVVLSGGAPLVVGTNQFLISTDLNVPSGAQNSQAPPTSRILDWQGTDISSQVTGGKLGGLLDVHNRMLPSILGDGQQTGSLNQFAKSFADAVNQILQAGFVGPQAGAAAGVPLFVYDASDPTKASGSFAVNSNITADTLAPVDASGNANGNALQLASLASSSSAGGINGSTFGAFFSGITTSAGQESATAQQNQQTQQQVVAQTRSLRDQISGVSLDEQAVMLMQFQRSYQAAARVLTTINSILDDTVNLIR